MEEGLIGKYILVVFEDGKDHFSSKRGICTAASDIEVVLDNTHFIARSRIVRIQVEGEQ